MTGPRMRVLYFSRDFTTHDLRFVRAIVRQGIEVCYLRLERDGVPYTDERLPDGAQMITWAGGGPPLPIPDSVADYLPAFREVVARVEPDLVQAGPVQSCGLIAALAGEAPTVLVSWGSDVLVDANRDAWFAWATRTAVRKSEGFVCDSHAVREAARRLAGGREPDTLQLPWGLELSAYDRSPIASDRARVRAWLGWIDCVVVLAARAWHPSYDVPGLVDAFALASARDPRLRLLLLGSGEDRARVESRIVEHGVDDLVHRPGMVATAELRAFLAAADLYASTVPSDGTSISLLEAMLYALPAIVVRNPGNAEWVIDGETGYLVAAGSAEAFAGRMLDLAQNATASHAMGERARGIVLTRADWESNVLALGDLYRRVLRRR